MLRYPQWREKGLWALTFTLAILANVALFYFVSFPLTFVFIALTFLLWWFLRKS